MNAPATVHTIAARKMMCSRFFVRSPTTIAPHALASHALIDVAFAETTQMSIARDTMTATQPAVSASAATR
jgi:hypothetical protein